jgi:hypothetical protein
MGIIYGFCVLIGIIGVFLKIPFMVVIGAAASVADNLIGIMSRKQKSLNLLILSVFIGIGISLTASIDIILTVMLLLAFEVFITQVG